MIDDLDLLGWIRNGSLGLKLRKLRVRGYIRNEYRLPELTLVGLRMIEQSKKQAALAKIGSEDELEHWLRLCGGGR